MVQAVNASPQPKVEGRHQPPSPKKTTVRRGRPSRDSAQFSSGKLRRLQIKLTQRGFERLERVRGLTDALSAVDVIRDALRVYEALVEAVNSGKEVVLENPKEPSGRERLRLW
jgi:hypothetical protein